MESILSIGTVTASFSDESALMRGYSSGQMSLCHLCIPPPLQHLTSDEILILALQHHNAPAQPVDQLGLQIGQVNVLLVDDGYEPVDLNVHLGPYGLNLHFKQACLPKSVLKMNVLPMLRHELSDILTLFTREVGVVKYYHRNQLSKLVQVLMQTCS